MPSTTIINDGAIFLALGLWCVFLWFNQGQGTQSVGKGALALHCYRLDTACQLAFMQSFCLGGFQAGLAQHFIKIYGAHTFISPSKTHSLSSQKPAA